MTNQPIWKLVASADDFALYIDTSDTYDPEVEMWECDENGHGYIYRFDIPQCRLFGDVLTVDPVDNTYGPLGTERRCQEWFSDDIGKVAESIGEPVEKLRASLCDPSPQVRMWSYLAIARYYGADNFDDPVKMDQEDWDRRECGTHHPLTREIAAALRVVDRRPPFPFHFGLDEDGDPIRNAHMWEDDSPLMLDVRLQVCGTTWSIHTGDSSYDQDHRGRWASTYIPFIGDPENGINFREVANYLLDNLK